MIGKVQANGEQLRYATIPHRDIGVQGHSEMPKTPSNEQLETWNCRVPARRMAEVPHDIHEALSCGWIECKNLVEWLGVDRKRLAKQVLQELGLEKNVLRSLAKLPTASALKQSFAIGNLLAESVELGDPVFHSLTKHRSDIVREWSAVLIGAVEDIPLKKRFAWIKPLADDENPGVREVAWIGLRNRVIADLDNAITCLIPWTGSRRERLRRYASEITRPCGVWAAHVPKLKQTPEMGLPILEPLRADESKYVRDSVANWLNDASKTRGPWVQEIAARWAKESECRETELILKRALRTLNKSKQK
jgi:3-methyladenine DNA glycosylase AlkC